MKSLISFFCTAILFFCLISSSLFSQVKSLKPEIGAKPDLGPEIFKDFEKRNAIFSRMGNGEITYKDLTQEEQELIEKYGEVFESPWDIIEGGCSWYCGGGPHEVTASSSLPAYKGITYDGENAHDLSFKNAWVEGVKGNGVGESLTYSFSEESPRITHIKIYNGYVKSEKAWQDNGRVKKLNMYVDGRMYAFLHLDDTPAEQIYKIPPLGKMKQKWDIKFEIAEVYPGNKYEDVAITEIYFDGIDVHCFASGTQVQVGNGETQSIETLNIGDQVLAYDTQTKQSFMTHITELAEPTHCEMLELTFEGGNELIVTADHPFLSVDNQWHSADPDKTNMNYQTQTIASLAIGNEYSTYGIDGLAKGKLVSIKRISEHHQKTYTIVDLERGDVFFVNGFAVGIEKLRAAQQLPMTHILSGQEAEGKAQNE